MADEDKKVSPAIWVDLVKTNGPWVSFIVFFMYCCITYVFPTFQKVGDSHLETMKILQDVSKDQAKSVGEISSAVNELRDQNETTINLLKEMRDRK